MKTLTITLFLALTSSICFTQSKEIDSLKHELAITKQDTSRVLIIAELCSWYRTLKPDSALFFGEKGMILSEKINFPKGLVRNTSYYGRVLTDLGNIPKSLAMYFKALQIAKDNNLLAETGLPLNYLGGNYNLLNEPAKALIYYKQAMKIHEKYHSEVRLGITLNNIGNTFLFLNQLDSADYYAKQAFNSYDKRKIAMSPLVFNLFANINFKLGKNLLASDYFHKALAQSVKSNSHQINALICNSFAKFFQKTNQIDSCIYYSKKGLEEAQLIAFQKGVLDNASLLAKIYETKDAKEALRYYKMANTAKESLFGAGNMQAIQSLIAQEEARQKEIETAKSAYNSQLKQYALLASLAILLIVAFFLYRNNLKEKKAKNLLQEKNEEIQSTLEKLKATQAQLIQSEKLASLGELTAGIAHEIQNPLNFVNNFSEVSSEMVDEMNQELDKGDINEAKAISNDLKQNLEKITLHGKRASSIVKGMLEHSKASSGEKELTDINALADEYLRLSYHGLRAKDKNFNSDFKTEFDTNLPKTNVIPQDMGRVLLNLINNAFYAAYESKKPNPIVTVTTKQIPSLEGQGWVSLTVKDNGNGIPKANLEKIFQPFFTTKPTGQGTGLGLSLAYDIITKGHGGTIEVVSKEGEGTEFIVKLTI